jgi:serine/threonine-protein kinase
VTANRADRAGHVLGERFRIDGLIGRGASADVYRALDLATSAYVAVKILRTSLAGDPTAKARFAREGELQARLRHRNIAALLASGITDREEPYLVVELLRGKNLRTVLKREGRVAPVRAASYAWQTLQGLAEVHAAGVLHRDLKPANIMLEPSPGPVDRVVLIDFGFASTEGSAKLTQQGAVVGSLRYIAPERLRGEKVDLRSDLYAVGVILFELLMGAPPFDHDDDYDLVEAHVSSEPPPHDASLPRSLDAVIRTALAKAQQDRYPSAAAMAHALALAARDLN